MAKNSLYVDVYTALRRIDNAISSVQVIQGNAEKLFVMREDDWRMLKANLSDIRAFVQ